MVQVRIRADRPWPQRGTPSSRTVTLVLSAFAISAGLAAWIAYPGDAGLVLASTAPSRSLAPPSFDERYLPAPAPQSLARNFSTQSVDRAAGLAADIRLLQAREQLARQMQAQDRRAATEELPLLAAAPSVPLPRPRPSDARIDAAGRVAMPASGGGQGDGRTLLQKLSDFFPAPIKLASLTSGGGLLRFGPDLAALGYDSFTAVYDISAQAVYLPDGAKLEAHSGLGSRMDKVDSIAERNVGVTPPGTYQLRPRERPFHGVRALRLIPVDSESTLGRTGLLAHSYLLGPSGDSNGCVSIRDYDRFLKAYDDGKINRLVVVSNLTDSITASRRSPAPS